MENPRNETETPHEDSNTRGTPEPAASESGNARPIVGNEVVRPLRTYKDDVAEALQKKKGSKVSIQAAERARKDEQRDAEKQQQLEALRAREREQALRAREAELAAEREKISKASEQEPTPEPAPEAPPASAREELIPDNLPGKDIEEPAEAHPAAGKPAYDSEEAGLTPDAREALERVRSRSGEIEKKAQIDEEEERIRREREALTASQDARSAQTAGPAAVPEERSHKTRAIVVSTLIFFLLGGGVLYGAYMFFFAAEERAPTLSLDTLILAEGEETIAADGMSGDELLQRLTETKNTLSIPENNITHIRLTIDIPDLSRTELLPASLLLSRIGENAPPALARSLLDDEYMLGIHASLGKHPFLILKPTYYENAFASMLAWERDITEDLAPFFTTGNEGLVVESETGTSTAPRRVTAIFEDRVVENKDTRILYNNRDEVVLLYSFVDRETLIITTNRATFLEIVKRMEAKRVTR